uniref:Sema domain-containing protein n=1 Tax=Tetranychus urticae TaxID=32264 RepID=A0A158P4X2_TETUR
MLILNLIAILQFFLSIEYSYSFRGFKNTQNTYYKALDSVYFRSFPFNKLPSYDIYVAGDTINIKIPKSVVNVSEIVNWKVVNLRRNKLMFVYKNKPRILIDRKTIRPMKLKPGTNPLTGPIIAFGDNAALHVPTIFNPNLTEPFLKWNYIEYLYFDHKNEEVSVLRSLPRLKDDDWKFIKEWKMMDYIHFDDKLYLLIKRSIWNEKTASVTQEISIIRLCLDKRVELISSAIEIRYNRPEFQNNQITGAIFICLAYYIPEKIFLLITHKTANQTLVHKRYFFNDFVSLFDKTGEECASGANNYTLMRYHLRSEVRSCQKTTFKSCSSNRNTVPSVELNFTQILDYHFIFADGMSELTGLEYAYDHTFNETHFCHQRIGYGFIQICIEIDKNFNQDDSIQNVEVFFFGFPFYRLFLSYNNLRYNESRLCEQYVNTSLMCYYKDNSASKDHLQLHYYFNHRPFGFFHVTEDTNEVFRKTIVRCLDHLSCIHCMMYGHSMDCIWSDSSCRENEDNVTQTVNHCFKITSISPLMFNSTSPETLTIELDRPLEFNDTQEYLDIKAGPNNHCTNITQNHNVSIFKCSMRLSESGKFKISVSLRNYKYADTNISALSTEKVDIVAPEVDYLPIIVSLVSGLTLISFIIVYVRSKKQQSKGPKKVTKGKVSKFSDSKEKQGSAETIHSVTRVQAKILASRMNTSNDSTIQAKPSNKPWTSGSSVYYKS